MTTQMIQCFEVLCEIRNFTKAAERLYISQSSLSKQLKNLETELDCQLIDRTQTPHRSHLGGCPLSGVLSSG